MTSIWQDIVAGKIPFNLNYRIITEKDGTMWQRSVGQIERGSDGRAVGATVAQRPLFKIYLKTLKNEQSS